MQQITDLFKGLSNTGTVTNHCKSGMIKIKCGELAVTIVHVCAQYYPWDAAPKYYACWAFYANCTFMEACSPKLMKIYNKKNKDKITEFSKIEDLINFIKK